MKLIGKIILNLLVLSYSLSLNAQTILTFAGGGSGGLGDGGPATASTLGTTGSGAFDAAGNYYFVQSASAPRVRKVNISGIITSVVGNGTYGFSGDNGPATAAAIKNSFIDVDAAGNIFIADLNNSRVRKVDVVTGIIHTIAGNGTASSTGDGGPATTATVQPADLCVDGYGNIFIGENGGSIRKINSAGIISTLAPGLGYVGMCLGKRNGGSEGSGYLYAGINVRIVQIDTATGHIDTIAGTGVATYNGDEIPATTANIKVYDLTIDKIGNLFIATYSGQRIRKIDTFGIIHTIAGTGISGFSGDGGAATAAEINNPEGVAVDICGNVYIADEANNRIRKVTQPPILTTPTITLSGIPSAFVGALVTVTATITNAGNSYIIHWLNHGIQFATTTVPSVTYTKPPGIDTITARVVSTATYGCYDSATSAGHTVKDSLVGVSTLIRCGGGIAVYPNPVHDVIRIDIVSNTSSPSGRPRVPNAVGGGEVVTICNLIGQIVYTHEYNSEKAEINIAALPTGIYVVKVTNSEGEKMITKIIKQ